MGQLSCIRSPDIFSNASETGCWQLWRARIQVTSRTCTATSEMLVPWMPLGNDHFLWHNVRTWKATKSFSCGCNWKPTWRGPELQSYLNGSINHSSHIKGHRKMAHQIAATSFHTISIHQWYWYVLVPVSAPSSKKSPLTFPSQVPVLRNGSTWRNSRIWDLVSKWCLLQSVFVVGLLQNPVTTYGCKCYYLSSLTVKGPLFWQLPL